MARNKTVGNARARVLFSVLLAFVVIAVVFFGGLYALKTRQMNVIMDETAFTVAELEKKSLESGATLMSAVSARIRHEERLADAMAKRRYGELHRFGEESFDRLHERINLARLAFLDPDRKPVEVFGLPLMPVTEISPFGAVFPSGIEVRLVLDTAGYLLLDVVAPWQVDGRLVGYVELTQDASKSADVIRQMTKCDIIVLARKDLMEHDAWEKAERLRGPDSGWDLLSGTIVMAQTVKAIPTSLGLLLEEAGQPRRVVVGGEGNRQVFNLAWLPLNDSQGYQVGNVVLLRDVTKASEGFRQTILVTAALGLLCAVLLFILLTAVFDDAEKREHARAVAERLQRIGGGREGMESLDLRELVLETGHRMERELAGLKLDLGLPGGPCMVVTDRLLLRDALHQLVMNAIEAAPDTAISLSVEPENRHGFEGWSVIVADDGAPIPGHFETAAAALAARNADRNGAGISLVERIASLIGADLFAANRETGGVAARLWIPVVTPAPAGANEKEAALS